MATKAGERQDCCLKCRRRTFRRRKGTACESGFDCAALIPKPAQYQHLE